ncbi:transmembrane protein 41A-like [Ischnura elegans]|uniref:transmembrane protein 41A-like n=1 Tax=Ischnura elegans TaxID=197161 RepID=UPI001ED87F23|nr:transmembrane protein 41A-like [Ischnura elegans]
MPNFLYLVLIISFATAWLYLLTILAPSIDKKQVALHFPNSLVELQELSDTLKAYYEKHFVYVLTLFCSAYLYKQSFMIPGSALLNLLAGALFGSMLALPIVCSLTAVGASMCFLISKHFGKDLLEKYFPDKIQSLQRMVQSNSHRLLYFLLFLRIFPVTPNWFINVASPIAGIPLHLFFITVLIGLLPYNLVCVQAGEVLSTLTTVNDLLSTPMLFTLSLAAILFLVPTLLSRKQHVHVS